MKRPLLALFTSLAIAATATANPFLHEFPADGKLEFKLEDKIHLAAFAWPRTLLSYALRFPAPPRADQLRLRDLATSKEMPFQLSEVNGNFAVVNFFADLPSGGVRRFELSRGTPATLPSGVKKTTDGTTILLDAGKLKIRLPASQTVIDKVPGPILQLNQFGDSTLVSPRRPVKSITTVTVESGPLFVACRVTYDFDGGGRYVATVKAIADYDYGELSEEMTGLAKDDGVFVENAWTDFHPTHRMVVGSPFGGTRRVDDPIVQPFRGEDPAFTGPTRIEDSAVEMLPCLTPYWPNGWGGNRSAAFWDEKSGAALGLFIADASKWQDHEYAIWTSADTLKVKYRYADGVLFWKWPLVTGKRLTGLTAYRHAATPKLAPLADQTPGASWQDEADSAAQAQELPVRLQIQYCDLSLNRVKDWVLEYPDAAKRPPTNTMKPGRQKSLEAYMKALPDCAAAGVTKGMFHPVGLRDMGYWVVPDFLRFRESMTAEQRSQATAMLLLAAYVAAEDEYAPMRTMLGGHPNFMADLKFPIAAAAFLFPEHPMPAEWRDQYEMFLELCGHFYVRPTVPAWEARGGRFTESIATYNWAFMSPTAEANRLGQLTGARNFYASPQLADVGDYLVGILTSPQFTNNHAVPGNAAPTWENGFRRLHPPQGAHSGKRGAGGSMYDIGEQLQRYRPLTAEHLMWGAFPAAGKGFEDRAGAEVRKANRGTNPHLTSAKYTGYGIVLRAGMDTPEEISVFLQQVDKGPNYRWGYANQNGSGDLYYYAGGKSYSGHEREEAGDSHVDDAFLSSNTGVYKDWHFACVGMNEVTRPFYDLGAAQFAEIIPETGPGAYSWPEYQSRSVMLVGTDYILVYDHILEPCGTRFAWNISRDDEMPFIQHIKGAEGKINLTDPKDGFVRGSLSTMIKGGGSHVALVTHKPDVQVVPQRRARGEAPVPFVRVKTGSSDDYLFQADGRNDYDGNGIKFLGHAGVIRQRRGGATELALFHGARIGAQGVTLYVDNPDLGISATFTNAAEIAGRYFTRKVARLTVKFERPLSPSTALFVDGEMKFIGLPASSATPATPVKEIAVELPAGEHRWEVTTRLPEPMPPVMLRTENRAGGATVFFTKVAAAEKYRVELSADSGASWKPVGETADDHFQLRGLANDTKVHVRAIALNRARQSQPANEYPLYVTAAPPPPPDGLKTELGTNRVRLTWGEVLGVSEYRLYRREQSASAFKEIFRGRVNEFVDEVNTTPAFAEPGLRAAALRQTPLPVIYEYAIAALNGNGEGGKSLPTDTDPRSWRNWNPTANLRFKRQSGFWLPPYVRPLDVPPEHYPDSRTGW